MKTLLNNYTSTYKGIAKEIWFLSVVTFINRAGAMVIPFLSLYLIDQKGFTLPQVGWIMTFYGFGSLVGNLIGGKLTDVIGYYKTIVLSLLIGGLGFIGIQFLDTFYSVCFGMFFLMIAVDTYRPAIFVAADAYSINNNVTRNIGLIRLAINLGFSIGPVIGGMLIARVSYASIFWVDGITCILASALLVLLLKPKKKKNEQDEKIIPVKEGVSPYRNPAFLLFFLVMVINAIAFIQYFSTVPIFYKQAHGLSEDTIGSILFLNGILIVFLEMPLIAWVERLGMSKITATIFGVVFLALSFIILNISEAFSVLIMGMILMTIGEMIGSPFSNALALNMAPKGRKGSYMGLYSMSFSISHIIGHNVGMNAIYYFDFDKTWYGMFALLIAAAFLLLYLPKLIKKLNLNYK